jgi:hypothetical protein
MVLLRYRYCTRTSTPRGERRSTSADSANNFLDAMFEVLRTA